MQKSRPLLGFLCLSALLCLPAHATIIQVDYTGVVRDVGGTGLGYSVGDAISGRMFIDTARVEFTQYCFYDTLHAQCEYESIDEQADRKFVTGGLVGANDLSQHHAGGVTFSGDVFVNDLFVPFVIGGDGQPADDYSVSNEYRVLDGTSYTGVSNFVRVFESINDFISGNGIFQEFSLTRDELTYYANMYGRTSEFGGDLLTGETYQNAINYNLTSIRVAPKTVPEPATLALLCAGLIGIALSRRFSRCSG